jgi:putative spermidine/putrescine transport system permease protein
MGFWNNKKTIFALTAPALLFILVFFLLPLLFIFGESFINEGSGFTFGNYFNLLKYRNFHRIFLRTLKIGLTVTPLAMIIAYPAAYVISRMKSGKKSLFMSIVILPLMTSPVARTYAWLIILGRFGLVNQTLRGLGFIDEPLRLLYTEGAITVGLLQLFLPLMVLTLVSAMENIPENLEEAAQSLGANKFLAFFKVVVPLSADGLVMGGILVFTGSITAYTTPAILGGTRVLILSTLLHQKSMVLMQWGNATVIAVVMFVTTLVIYSILRSLRPKTL